MVTQASRAVCGCLQQAVTARAGCRVGHHRQVVLQRAGGGAHCVPHREAAAARPLPGLCPAIKCRFSLQHPCWVSGSMRLPRAHWHIPWAACSIAGPRSMMHRGTAVELCQVNSMLSCRRAPRRCLWKITSTDGRLHRRGIRSMAAGASRRSCRSIGVECMRTEVLRVGTCSSLIIREHLEYLCTLNKIRGGTANGGAAGWFLPSHTLAVWSEHYDLARPER
jgi:hypothetical protein